MNETVGCLHLFANFDSGNMQSASLVDPLDELRGRSSFSDSDQCSSIVSPSSTARSLLGGRHTVVESRAEYFLQVAPDCVGQPYENLNRSWFYFGVCLEGNDSEGSTRDQQAPAQAASSSSISSGKKAPVVFARHKATFTIANLSATNLIFDHDNRPVYSTDTMDGWSRLPQPLLVTYHDRHGATVHPQQLSHNSSSQNLATVANGSSSGSSSMTNHAERRWKKGAYSCTQRVSWTYTFTRPGETVYFAMCYPYSYHRQLQAIDEWTRLFGEERGATRSSLGPLAALSPSTLCPPAGTTPPAVDLVSQLPKKPMPLQGQPASSKPSSRTSSVSSAPPTTPPREARRLASIPSPPPSPGSVAVVPKQPLASVTALSSLSSWADASMGVYFLRETLCFTPQNRRVDLLTITGHNGKSNEDDREPYISSVHPVRSDVVKRPHRFPDKKIVLISCRVHPGETPASHVLHGLIEFLTSQRDCRSAALREHFVFYIIPMLNPDGVAAGHYRTDLRGVNLNRMYDAPDPRLHPSIYAARELFLSTAKSGRLVFYMDLHAHASKRGCFVFGNAWDDQPSQIETLLYPKLLSLNTAHFDFLSCDFTSRSMQQKNKVEGVSKEGTARVALAMETGLVLSYTLEASYNMGTCLNAVAANEWDATSFAPQPSASSNATNSRRSSTSSTSSQISSTPAVAPSSALKYTPDTYSDLGRGIGVAILDMFSLNPASRLPSTPFVSINGVRNTLERQLRQLHLDQERGIGLVHSHGHMTKLDHNKALEKSSVAYALPVLNAYNNASRHKLRHRRESDDDTTDDDGSSTIVPFRLQV